MAYASATEIVEEFKKLDIASADSIITTAKVTRFLDEANAEINTYLANRYILPITGTEALLFLKKIEIDLVVFRVSKIINIKKALSNKISQDITEGSCYRMAIKRLEGLASGKLHLVDATLLSGKRIRSLTQKCDIKKVFKRDVKQW